jgi:hypothetical protein
MIKMKRAAIAAAVALSIFMVGCDDVAKSEETVSYEDAKYTGKLTVTVVDAETLMPMDAVEITRVSEAPSLLVSLDSLTGLSAYADSLNLPVLTDSTGFVVFDSLAIGEHTFQITKLGYAPRVFSRTIENNNSGSYVSTNDLVLDAKMTKTSISLTGKVLIEKQNGDLIPAVGITVAASLVDDFSYLVPTVTAKTDVDGMWTLTGLTATEKLFVRTLSHYDVTTLLSYEGVTISNVDTINSVIVNGESFDDGASHIYVDPTQMKISKTIAVVMSENSDSIGLDSNFVITFSEAIDITKINLFSQEDSKVKVNVNGNPIAISVVWSNLNKTMTISPVDTVAGQWFSGEKHNITFDLYTVHNTDINGEDEFGNPRYSFFPRVVGAIIPISALLFTANVDGVDTSLVEYNTSVVNLTWNDQLAVIGYDIYVKRDGEGEYVYDTTTIDTTCALPTYERNDDGSPKRDINNDLISNFADGGFISIKVVPYNSSARGSIMAAPALMLSDKVAPTISGDKFDTTSRNEYMTSDYDNTSGPIPLLIDIENISFDEPMDTTLALIIPNTEAALSYTAVWRSTTQIEISQYVVAGGSNDPYSSYADLIVPLVGLTDLAGNACLDTFVITYAAK